MSKTPEELDTICAGCLDRAKCGGLMINAAGDCLYRRDISQRGRK